MSVINGVLTSNQVLPAELEDTDQPAGTGSVAASLLPDPTTQLLATGDPASMMAALMIRTAQDERDLSRQTENTESAIQDQQEKAQVTAMHQKANEMRMDAVVTGAMGMAAGALSVAGSACDKDSGEARMLDANSKLWGTGRDILTQVGKADEQDADGNIAAFEHAAAHAGRAASQAYDSERDAQKLLDSAVDFYKEYSSALGQAKSAAIQRT